MAAAAGTPEHRLARYSAKRDFSLTSEPHGDGAAAGDARSFVIQKHAASRLHYDFRLELDGVLVSWAVPKGPSYDPADKRMAIRVEDHPLSYGAFEGTIPPKQYGAGTVIVWDTGTWEPVGDPHAGLDKGKLVFRMRGQKMTGLWELVKIAKAGERQEPWLLFKKRDEFARARAEYDVVSALPDSVIAKPLAPAAPAATPRRRPAGATARNGAALRGAVPADLPVTLSPQLATLASAVPADGEWLYEIKFDGYRLLARIDHGQVRLFTRGGHDWSDKLPALVRGLAHLGIGSAWLDGEIVVLGADGAPDFGALQKAFDSGTGRADIVYFVFDLPYFEGQDLRAVDLLTRRQRLKALLAATGTAQVRFSADFRADAASVLESACRMNLEGVIAKRADSPYVSRRSDTWLKLKCGLRQEFVVCGYAGRSDDSSQIGSLLLGVHDADGALVSVGSVGTGWDADEAQRLGARLKRLETEAVPFTQGAAKPGRWSRRAPGSQRWVVPRLVAEVTFAAWTSAGQIRHAAYVGLRADKPARSVVREAVAPLAGALPARTARSPGSPGSRRSSPSAPPGANGAAQVSHGDRVIDTSTRLTKLDLVRYYESVADRILPHLAGRPCSLVRGPTGVAGPLFFQKHGEKIGIPGITELDPALWPGHAALMEINTPQALVAAARMNVIEFHTWNARSRRIDRPDRAVFDLDPGEGTPWEHVQEAAALTRSLLAELGLASWLKTSGGKGLHVVVPLASRWGPDAVKQFARAVARHLAKVIPARFVVKSGPSNRVGKLFVDYLRNGHGATTAAAFSARARPGLGVSMPVAWDDLPALTGGAQWTIANAREHLSFQTVDPWEGYWPARQSLTAAMKTLGLAPLTGKAAGR